MLWRRREYEAELKTRIRGGWCGALEGTWNLEAGRARHGAAVGGPEWIRGGMATGPRLRVETVHGATARKEIKETGG